MSIQVKELTPNHEIMIYETNELYGEIGRFRVLQFSNEAVQGAIDLDHPERILFEYPRAMIHLMALNNPAYEDVFLVGHGIGTLPNHLEEKRFVVAELDEQVLEWSKLWFGYRGDNVKIGDGRHLLEQEALHSFDYIIVDAFTEKGTPRHLTSVDFFVLAQSKLNDRGAILLNVLGRGDNDRHVNAIHSTLSERFPYVKAFLLPAQGSSYSQNLILMGSANPIRYQTRQLAGFIEVELDQGHIIQD